MYRSTHRAAGHSPMADRVAQHEAREQRGHDAALAAIYRAPEMHKPYPVEHARALLDAYDVKPPRAFDALDEAHALSRRRREIVDEYKQVRAEACQAIRDVHTVRELDEAVERHAPRLADAQARHNLITADSSDHVTPRIHKAACALQVAVRDMLEGPADDDVRALWALFDAGHRPAAVTVRGSSADDVADLQQAVALSERVAEYVALSGYTGAPMVVVADVGHVDADDDTAAERAPEAMDVTPEALRDAYDRGWTAGVTTDPEALLERGQNTARAAHARRRLARITVAEAMAEQPSPGTFR